VQHGSKRGVPASAHFVRDASGVLCVDGVSLDALAREHGTPLHVVSAEAIRRAYGSIRSAIGADALIAYAMKANGNPAIVSMLGALGAGADVVSGGELHWALASGIPAKRIVMSGVGKSDAEIAAAIDAGVRAIHVESEPELEVVEAIARARGSRASIGLRLNPDVDPKTHPHISTGLHDTKFGLELDVARALLPRIVSSPHLDLDTIASHIGSQIPDASSVGEAVAISAAFAEEAALAGANVKTLDAGGGWPIAYGDEDVVADTYAAFGASIREAMARTRAERFGLAVEPGRALVGDAGIVLTRVLFVKEQAGKRFVIVDAAMTELIRPALYDAYHAIVPVSRGDDEGSPCDIVGPVCETGDFFARDRALPRVKRGDLLAIRGTGAYGASMSSEYNARPRAAEVMIDHGVQVIRARGRVEDLHRVG
jgi:diaminopimelate decarboxylase